VTDDEAVVPLGRRLEAFARARVQAWAPRPAWAAPLAVALRHTEEVADVLGERFERTELPMRSTAQLPVPSAVAVPARRVVPQPPAPADRLEPAARQPADLVADVRAVPADVRSRLRREVGPAADLMRVHDGPQADAQARAADADAVTVGRDVYLRQGRWAPRRQEGVALLAHEATHVARLVDPGHAWHRAVGENAEEALARAREWSVLGAGRVSPPTASGGAPTSPGVLPGLAAPFRPALGPGVPAAVPGPPSPMGSAAVAAHAVAAVPSSGMRADVDRALTPPTAAPDLEALRRSLVADVLQRLRSEIERGA